MAVEPGVTEDRLPWMERYRPKRINDIVHQYEVVKMLNTVVLEGNMPHLLFYGPPGTGKTSAALALANELFSKDDLKNRVLEVNASDNRGITFVRERIKMYARTAIPKGRINPETKREVPNWKMIILDEADMITPDAQSALRRIIEVYSKTTRFILICNYVHKIIDPLFSRCSCYRFQPISTQDQKARLSYICDDIGMKCENEALDAIIRVSEGDLRRGVTLLQTAHKLFSKVNSSSIFEIAGQPPDEIIEQLIRSCQKSIEDVNKSVINIGSEGWDVSAIFREVVKYIINMDISDVKKAKICLEVSHKDFALNQGAGENIQLMSLCINMHNILCGKA